MPVKQYIPMEIADALAVALDRILATHSLSPKDDRPSFMNGEQALANYNKFKQGE